MYVCMYVCMYACTASRAAAPGPYKLFTLHPVRDIIPGTRVGADTRVHAQCVRANMPYTLTPIEHFVRPTGVAGARIGFLPGILSIASRRVNTADGGKAPAGRRREEKIR